MRKIVDLCKTCQFSDKVKWVCLKGTFALVHSVQRCVDYKKE